MRAVNTTLISSHVVPIFQHASLTYHDHHSCQRYLRSPCSSPPLLRSQSTRGVIGQNTNSTWKQSHLHLSSSLPDPFRHTNIAMATPDPDELERLQQLSDNYRPVLSV